MVKVETFKKPAKTKKAATKKTTKRKPGPGAGNKFDFWSEANQKIMTSLYSVMSTDEEVAYYLGISRQRLNEWLNEKPEHMAVKEKAMSYAKVSLRRSMFESAMGGNPTSQIWLSKNVLGFTDKPDNRVDEEREIGADVLQTAVEVLNNAKSK